MKLQLLRQEEGYSIYENPDANIKAAIQNIEDPTELTEFWIPEFRDDKWSFKETLENGSILLQSDNGNLTTISKEEYDKEFKEAKLQKINRAYSVGDLMNQYFMPMYIGQKIYHKMFSQPLRMGFRQETFYDGVNPIFMVEEYHTWDYGYKTSFEASFGNGNGCMYFNLQGEIENRDYNQNLNDESEFVPKDKVIEEFIQALDRRIGDSVLEVSSKNLNYFIDGFAFKIYNEDSTEIEIEYFPHATGNRYFKAGESYRKITKPAKLEVIPKEEFLDFMRKKCNNLQQNKFWEWTQEND